MSHTSIPEPPGFAELSTAEQIEYVQALWDRILETAAEIPVPDSHLRLIEERLAHFQEDPTRVHSAYDILERLTQSGE